MQKRVSSVAAVGLVLVLALSTGCVISDIPLSDPAPSEADKLLYGCWRYTENDTYTKMEFAAPTDTTPKTRGIGDQRVMVVTIAQYKNEEKQPFASSERGFVTKIGDATFLNLYDEQESGYHFLRYTIKGDTLDVWTLSADAMAEAIRRGDLPAGEVTYDRGSLTKVRITRPLKTHDPNEIRDKLRSLLTGKSAESIFPESRKRRYERVADKK